MNVSQMKKALENAKRRAASVKAKDAEIETMKAGIVEAEKLHDEAIAKASAEAKDAADKLKAATDEIEKCKAALANPAFADAAMVGLKNPPKDEATTESADDRKGRLWREYGAIKDAKEQRAFWVKNRDAMK